MSKKMWWEHYHLSSEPYLSQEPLNTKEELDLFYGRGDEIKKLNVILEGTYKQTLLLTGNPGVGKTSLINKLFYDEKGYIHVKLSEVKQFDEAEVVIAKSCINTYSKYNKRNADELRERLISNITRASGNSVEGGIVPSGVGVKASSSKQKSISKVRNLEVVEIVKDALQKIGEKGRIHLVLDESDFFDKDHSDELIHLSSRIKELLPKSSILVLINRDVTSELKKSYNDLTSLARSTFSTHYIVGPVWKYGETDIEEVLKTRFQNTLTSLHIPFPLNKKACSFIDLLSSGNFRILIQYLENVLKFGAANDEKVPLGAKFVQEQIFNDFTEVILLTEQQDRVLHYLKKKPTHVNDPEFLKLYKRTHLQDILKKLERRLLVTRSTKKPGVEQVYSVTSLGKLVLDHAIIE